MVAQNHFATGFWLRKQSGKNSRRVKLWRSLSRKMQNLGPFELLFLRREDQQMCTKHIFTAKIPRQLHEESSRRSSANSVLTITGRPRFGSVAVWEGNGSSGSGFRFWRFLCKKSFLCFQYRLTGKNSSGSGFGSWKTVPAVPVPVSVSGKTVPTVPVSGSGSVPEPPCNK